MSAKKRIWLYLGIVSIVAGAAGADLKLDPAVVKFDFESGSVGAWSSYPPAQDTAYDPTIWVKKIEGNETAALLREIVPNDAIEYVFGMRKKLNLHADGESLLSFKYYVKSFRPAEAVIVKLAFGDGTSVEKRIPVRAGLRWTDAQVPFRDIVEKGKAKRLEAVAFMALIPQADPEALLKFAIDDVSIKGYRPARFEVLEPENEFLEEFDAVISKKHYGEGEAVKLQGKFPCAVKDASAVFERALTGDKTRTIAMKKHGDTWSADVPKGALGKGIWKATASGRDANGREIRSTLVFLIRPKNAPAGHPGVLVSSAGRDEAAKAAKSGRGKEIWEKLKASAEAERKKVDPGQFKYNLDAYDEVYWLPTYRGYASTIRSLSGHARANGLVYLLSGENAAGQAAKQALLKMAEWPSFVHPHILNQGQFTYWPVGLVILDMALGYDWIYDILSPGERKKIAACLYHNGVTEIFKEYVRDNRVSSDTSNWISHVTGGGILGALAIRGEYSAAELEPYLTGMILKVNELVKNTYDRDGNYGEGYGYHNFTTETLAQIMPALEMNFGIEFPGVIFDAHTYLLYQTNFKTGEIYDFGDTGSHLAPMANFAPLLKKTKDPLLGWLYGLAPGDEDMDLLFAQEGVKPREPSILPGIKLFRDVGTAVFRSGFGDGDFAFIFRCGPFYNHQHFDQGSFFLVDRGEDFLLEGGKTDYYNDPWYQKFFIQPGAHNCILADGNVESQIAGDLLKDVGAWRDSARITDFLETGEGAFVSGDLTKIYKKKFKSLSRNILYLKPRTIVLIDQAQSAEANGAKTMEIRFHPPLKKDAVLKDDRIEIRRPAASLFIKTLAPDNHGRELLKRPLSLAEFGSENPVTMSARGFIQLSGKLEPKGTTFINVLSTDERAVSQAEKARGADFIEMGSRGQSFFINKAAGAYAAGDVRTDALVFAPRANGYQAFKVTEISEGQKTTFSAARSVSVVVEKGRGLDILYSAAQKTKAGIHSAKKPGRVLINGVAAKNWTYKDKMIGLDFPEGNGRIRID